MSRMIDSTESKARREDGETALFAPDTRVRVSDLVGDLRDVEGKRREEIQRSSVRVASPVRTAPVTAPTVRHGGPLRLGWYDWAVIAMIVSSFVAGFFCLLAGK